MANYVGQDISGLNLTGQNLTGADFTNANATNVNFTNAIITNAIFKNTLITGATLTGITFSNVQKGHLLLRAANHTNSAVNNLTSLTPAEFRIIQPAVGTDTIARISTVTVKIPNSQGEGYTVSVTPVISQLVCIFVATSQNIIITTGGTQIRTIRSNGTVVQDVSNGNTTLNYLKIDSISYRLTVGNGDGVIAMIPVDLNVYQVNGSGLGDIVSLNVGSASTTLNMNNNGITNVSSIQGWNVKEITAGTGIGVTATNGSYEITNSAVVRDVSAGTGITVSTVGGVATITNSAVVRDISAGTGITVSTTGGVATLQNSGILSVSAASGTPGITVSTASGVATLQNTGILSVGAASGTPGITVSTASGVATLQNTGILSVASGTGISVGTSNGIATITNTLTNDVVLWFSGNVTITSVINKINLPFTSAGKIDLALYNLKYEIDINWDWQSVTAPANSFISMGFQTSTIPPSGVKAANTIWTRNSQSTASPQTNTPSIFDQVFNDVFIFGYAVGQGIGEAYRYRTMMSGELSRATTRPQQYSGDFAPNSRLIMNRFLTDTVLYDSVNGASQLKFYPPAGDGEGQMQIAGTAVWEMAYNNLYNDIAAGIDNIFVNFSSTADMATSTPRAGYITYRIYRVRK